MTLKDYYLSLPEGITPKSDFVNKLASACMCCEVAVRNWCYGKNYPANKEKQDIIKQMTNGVPLVEFYNSLPDNYYPRQELIKKLINATGKTGSEVRNWCAGKNRPKNPTTKMIISITTGIPVKDL